MVVLPLKQNLGIGGREEMQEEEAKERIVMDGPIGLGLSQPAPNFLSSTACGGIGPAPACPSLDVLDSPSARSASVG